MTNRLMMSVAAIALLAGTGFANAQGTGGKETGGAAVQQSAPPAAAGGAAGGAAMPNHESTAPSGAAPGGMKSTQSEPKGPAAAPKTQRAEDNMGNQKSKGMSSENETKGPAKDMKAEGRDNDAKPGNMKAEGREGRDTNMKAEGRDNNMKAEGKDGKSGNMNAETKGNERSQTTTGQAGAGAKISTEQRTQITSVIREQHVAPVTNVNFSISIGTRVPRDVSFHPLPAEVVTIYPEWRGYEYILVRDQILVIDPRSYEIVAVLDV
jgi:Protein of unknown function (DUF1236)